MDNSYGLIYWIAELLFKIQCALLPDDERFMKHADILIKNRYNAVEGRTCVSYYLRLHYYEKFDTFQCHQCYWIPINAVADHSLGSPLFECHIPLQPINISAIPNSFYLVTVNTWFLLLTFEWKEPPLDQRGKHYSKLELKVDWDRFVGIITAVSVHHLCLKFVTTGIMYLQLQWILHCCYIKNILCSSLVILHYSKINILHTFRKLVDKLWLL